MGGGGGGGVEGGGGINRISVLMFVICTALVNYSQILLL